jgi:YVTN family beta-propeller protein
MFFSSPGWSSKRYRPLLLASLISGVFYSAALQADPPPVPPTAKVGLQKNGSVVLPDSQVIQPAGRQITVVGRPSIIAIRPDHKTAVVINGDGNTGFAAGPIVIFDLVKGTVLQQLSPFTGAKVSLTGAVYSPDGQHLYASDYGNNATIDVYQVAADGTVTYTASVALPTPNGNNSIPAGLAISADGNTIYAALNGLNELAVINAPTLQVTAQIPVGNAPWGVALDAKNSIVWVTNEGGLVPTGNDPTNSSDGTNILVNPTTAAASTGSVSGVDAASGTVKYTIQVGLEPTALVLHDSVLFVANTNSDSISVIDPKAGTLVYTFPLFPGVAYGSQPNDINFLPDGTFVVSLGGNNALALYTFASGSWAVPPTLDGLIPTGWYPGFIAVDGVHNQILVSNVRGIGLEGPDISKGPNPKTNKTGPAEISTYSVVLQIAIPNAQQLAAYTATVIKNNSFLKGQVGDASTPANDTNPIPTQLGAASPVKHVFYILKENRTYDQILGDEKGGNGDPKYTQFGKKITPNLHALEEQFVLLDNYYAPSLNSADGHQWANQALAPDYLEKELNTNARSYPSAGGDAMAYATSGFLWQDLVNNGGNLRVYGEYAYEGNGPNNLYGDWTSWYNDSLILEGKKKGQLHCPLGSFPGVSDVPTIQNNLDIDFPPFDTEIPDQYRVDVFLLEFNQYVTNNNLPSLVYLWLCDDHTSGISVGFPTPAAQVADNDLAVGRVIEAISHSPYWNNSVIFITEDDAQDGVDHVDGHRTTGYVVGPYVKRKTKDSTYYNQLSIIRTIEQILGLPPMNQHDLVTPPMSAVFTNTPDYTPYTHLPNNIRLNTLTKQQTASATATSKLQVAWQKESAKMFARPQKADSQDPNLLNHAIWYATKGFNTPYPGDKTVLFPRQVKRSPYRVTYDD